VLRPGQGLHRGHRQLPVIVFLLTQQQSHARAFQRARHQPLAGDGAQALDRLVDEFFTMRQYCAARAGLLIHQVGQQLDENDRLAGAGSGHTQHIGVIVPGGQCFGYCVGLVGSKVHFLPPLVHSVGTAIKDADIKRKGIDEMHRTHKVHFVRG
jgi:hypothetical protein